MAGIVVAVVSATVMQDGSPITIRQGEAWDASAPVVVHNPALFSSNPTRARHVGAPEDRPVEQSTRRPGEKSRARRG